MKPFNLEAAKAGDAIITRNGEEVKFVAYVPEATAGHRFIILSKHGGIRLYYENGNYYSDAEDEFDLFMAPKKRIVWVNFYSSECTHYDSEEAADKRASLTRRIGGKAYPVEIEE